MKDKTVTPESNQPLQKPKLEEPTDSKEKDEKLKLSLDDSSNKNRNFIMTFLLLQIYILVAVGGTTDLQLLMPESVMQLPIINFSVPLFGFYILAPVFLIAFHFNILFNLLEHSRRLAAWTRLNSAEEDRLLLPAFMFNSMNIFKPGQTSYSLLRFIVFLIVFLMPLGLLTLIQWRFSDYHSFGLTLWHFILVIADLFLLATYWERIINTDLHDKKYENWIDLWRHNVKPGGSFTLVGWLWKPLNLFPVLLPIAICVDPYKIANLFDIGEIVESLIKKEWLEWTAYAGFAFFVIFLFSTMLNWKKLSRQGFWGNQKLLFLSVYSFPFFWKKETRNSVFWVKNFKFHQSVFSSSALFAKFWRSLVELIFKSSLTSALAFLITIVAIFNLAILILIKNDAIKTSWFFTPIIEVKEQRLVKLSPDKDVKKDKDKKLPWWNAYIGVTLNDRDLRLANFESAVLYKADFRRAQLQGAELSVAQLQGASLVGTQLQGANLSVAQLQGADLRGARLQGADLRGARLQGANLSRAQLYGSRIDKVKLYGADIQRLDFKTNFGKIDRTETLGWYQDNKTWKNIEYKNWKELRDNVLNDELKKTLPANKIAKISQRLKEVEKRYLDFDKKTLEKFREGSKEDFIALRQKYACNDARIAFGIIRQYKWRSQAQSLLNHIKTQCPAVLEELKKIPKGKALILSVKNSKK